MGWRNSSTRYGTLSVGIHWLMLLLFIAVYACIEMRGFYPKGSVTRDALKTWHYMLGVLVFLLAWVRIGARFSGPTPDIVPALAAWQRVSSQVVHLALYALMIVMPLTGWLMLSAGGKTVPFFGLELPALIAENKHLAKTIKEVHETIGTAGYYLIGVHAAAALYHHYLVRDNTLMRMLPWRR